ncbi:glycerol kinase [Terriglobus roseus DSM 18391]|uniref:Glycerol kinase n=1 Tax=Terriglobus roseus (strain DSM 18391 / NRRL B-41598 / KBS 63) TaxID=926566 RepID=I3ZB07_TERRK|nr:glycerol kinase GlpK [Terriglobus roseus]AFL86425.1 glycerol kinase [Terriglobus roseus DSM 18391]
MSQYILALDQGTTSSRAILFDRVGALIGTAQHEFTQIFPAGKQGWVEHDPFEILTSQMSAAVEVLGRAGVRPRDVAAIGITNQRETAIVWDRETGRPVYNAVVWQDRRTADACAELVKSGAEDDVRRRTGLRLDPYFSGTKVAWILDNISGARERAERGELAFGTVDSWLIWNLTSGKRHITDRTNASRTLLYNIVEDRWDDELLRLLRVPRSMMPEVVWSSEALGPVSTTLGLEGVEIAGIAGDQQSALFGQMCTRPGDAKNTYGTGCFLLQHMGSTFRQSEHRLLTTLACSVDRKLEYALEGSVFIGGAVVQWLRDGLGIIDSSSDVEALALSVPDSGGVMFVPAFTGMGAPHWDPYASGMMIGIGRGTTKAHIARAAVDSIALQTADLMRAMNADTPAPLRELRVDGGAAANNMLMQFQADLLSVPVHRPACLETTAMGAAFLAGLAVGFWPNTDEIQRKQDAGTVFQPQHDYSALDARWQEAIARAKGWNRPL